MNSKPRPAAHVRVVRFLLKLNRRYVRNFPYFMKRLLRRLRHTVPVMMSNRSGVGSVNKIVAMTVSTNYTDLLELVIEANEGLFDHWIVVTQESDMATRALLERQEQVSVIFWDPKAKGRLFDKGSALLAAQTLAYRKFPNCWYLVLDSDVALPTEFSSFRDRLPELDSRKIYGAERTDYGSYSDFLSKRNGVAYGASNGVYGYFQLYALPLKSKWSYDASRVDIDFRDLFFWWEVLQDFSVSHFGVNTENWQGRKTVNDFVIDSPS